MNNKILSLLAVAFAGVACSQIEEVTPTVGGSEEFVLYAVAPGSGETRIAFQDNYDVDTASGKILLSWESGDSFEVTDGTNNYTFTYVSDNAFSTTDGALQSGAEYTATFDARKESVTQVASDDANHLDDMLTLSQTFTYDGSAITFDHDMAALRIIFTAPAEIVSLNYSSTLGTNATIAIEGHTANEAYKAYIGIDAEESSRTFTVIGTDANGTEYAYSASPSSKYFKGECYTGIFDLVEVTAQEFSLSDLSVIDGFDTLSPWILTDGGEIAAADLTALATLINEQANGTVSLAMPNVTALGASSESGEGFYTCLGLGKVTLGAAGVTLGDNALRACSNITEIENFASITSLGTNVFHTCKKLTSVDVAGLTDLPEGTFRECQTLAEVKNAENIESVGKYAFRNALLLTSLEFAGVTSLNGDAFYQCNTLVDLKLTTADAITLTLAFNTTNFDTSACTLTLGATEVANVKVQGMWNSVTWLKIVDTNGNEVIPAVVDEDDPSQIVLADLTGDENFSTDEPWIVLDETLVDGDGVDVAGLSTLRTLINAAGNGVVDLEMPNVTSVPAGSSTPTSFYGCTGLKSVTLLGGGDDGVALLGGAFRSCSNLKSFTGNISNFANNSVRQCTELESVTVTYNKAVTLGGSDVFKNTPDTCVLYLGSTEYEALAGSTTWASITWASVSLYSAE